MKKFVKILSIALLSMTLGASAYAQDWKGVNRDDFGNVVRGSYLTNEWFDNWYISASGGIMTSFSKINDPIVTPQFDFSILKWFTPCVGVRIGYTGFKGKEYLYHYNPYQINHSILPFDSPLGGPGTLSYGHGYIHGDFFWNLSNTIWGYKYDRFYNVSLYPHAGYVRMYDEKGFGSENNDNELVFGFGIYNSFRIVERLNAIVDIRFYDSASRYKTYEGVRTERLIATVGLAYNIYKTYWNRLQPVVAEGNSAKAEAEEAKKALVKAEADNAALEQKVTVNEEKIAEKEAEVKKLDESKTVLEVAYLDLLKRANGADLVLYYYINVDKLNFSELRHLDEYVSKTLAADPNHVFYLTGSADKGTGSYERNTFLCRSRAYGVRDILIKDYGVKPENIVIKATLISDKHLDGALDRCVMIESK